MFRRGKPNLGFLLVLTFLMAAGCRDSSDPVPLDWLQPDFVNADARADAARPDLPDTAAPPEVTAPPDLRFELVPETLGPQCEEGEGCFLDKCSNNGQCQSGWCVDHMGESVCSMTCQEECPPGWTCQQVAGAYPDLVYVCVSDYTNLCRPCSSGNDCKTATGAEDVCVSYGADGNFCGGGCSEEKECPWGFTCKEAETVDGIMTKQCVADAGICPCTSKSIELSLWTPCEVENEWGVCQGKRICEAQGLSDCTAPMPQQESCNGLDDDCDDLDDEPNEVDGEYVSLCSDDNQCTQDSCLGEEGCQHEPLTGTECMDGDICTTADHCDDGACTGSPVICDDKDPCTDDVCTEEGGCAYSPNNESCDDGDPCTVADQCKEGECTGFAIDCDCLADSDCEALEDGDLCNGTLYCNLDELPHKCKVIPESVVECPQPEGPEGICLKTDCDPNSGECSFLPDHEGYACSAGDKCIVGQECQEGSCVGGSALNCQDNNACTEDTCDSDTGCIHEPLMGECSDGNVCTTADFCDAGVCVSGPPLNCDDDNVCTADSCDQAIGCVHELTIAPDAACCETPDDCPPDFGSPPACDNQKTCQGSSKTAICVDNQCGTAVEQDDSACVGLADDCGLFKDIVCSGETEQPLQACLGFCVTDEDCDPYAHCDGVCKSDSPIGQPCLSDSECESDNCNPAPGGVKFFCNAQMHDCSLDDGTGVHAGFEYCFEGDVWTCKAADAWAMTECKNDCGFYLGVDSCQAAACASCPAFCAADDDCDANAHCDTECVEDQELGSSCDEDSDCASGNCGPAPGGGDYCIPLTDECALDDGSGVDAGFGICVNGDVWTCGIDKQWEQADCADDCGFFADVDACVDGACVPCLESCQDNADCDDGAHCDTLCVPDLADGIQCDEGSDCVSGYCMNGFCCDQGDCCSMPADCPLKYTVVPLCDDKTTCQGHRVDAGCIGFICSSLMVSDDSGCTQGLEADSCGLYPAVHCTGQQDQVAPACSANCAADEDCDAVAHCDGNQCTPDLGWGESCDENSDCAGDLCHLGKCCKQACGTEACLTGNCGGDGECTWHTSGHQNCAPCHTCNGQGQCAPESAEGAGATSLSCTPGDEGCRRCNAGACTSFTSGQHHCPANHNCNAQGKCQENQPDYKIVCWDAYPGSLGHWVSEWCPAGYQHDYHTCGGSANIDDYTWGPYYQDKLIAHNNGNDHCWCCCNCNMICVKCKK